MRIALLNAMWLPEALRGQGCEVVSFGAGPDFDVDLTAAAPRLRDAIEQAMNGPPDVLIVEVFGLLQPFWAGLDECPWPMVCFAVDSSLNAWWLSELAPMFDHVFADQREAALALRQAGASTSWLPLWAFPAWFAHDAPAKEHDVAFVGRITDLRLKRRWLVETLERSFSVKVVGRPGDATLSLPETQALFARSRIVLNENLFDGVTMRVFQALASGSLLLTERQSAGLTDLFQDGRHLVTFSADDVVAKTRWLLDHPEERESMARAGQAECLARHTAAARIETVCRELARVAALGPRPVSQAVLAERRLRSGRALARIAQRAPAESERLGGMAESAARQAWMAEGLDETLQGKAAQTLGLLAARRGEEEAAITWLTEAHRLQPAQWRPAMILGRLLGRAGRADEARLWLLRGLERLEAAVTAWGGAGREAVEEAGRILRENAPLGAALWLALGRAHASVGRRFDVGFLKGAPEIYPDTAAEWYALAVRHGGGAAALRELGLVYQAEGAPDLAFDCFEKASRLRPDDPDLYELAGECARLAYRPDWEVWFGLAALKRNKRRPPAP